MDRACSTAPLALSVVKNMTLIQVLSRLAATRDVRTVTKRSLNWSILRLNSSSVSVDNPAALLRDNVLGLEPNDAPPASGQLDDACCRERAIALVRNETIDRSCCCWVRMVDTEETRSKPERNCSKAIFCREVQ